ncbi:uncharacterized protein LOC133198007 [Saccostrea echinata]|uniref:uncharacterized protein LOC133198007 n=1 Tax=Saccostrea echinata TaxID=191078 RepID=UPI002A82A609|nr:uncharacterized protein LOC133198007 [Saccostrea echinata]
MFAVVHFPDEDCVECVPMSWLHEGKCYWPQKEAKKKIKNLAIPDKEKWTLYNIRKLGQDYEDYDTARKYCKKAEETSNFETDDDTRKKKTPARFYSSSESEDDNDIDGKGSAGLPKPPKVISSLKGLKRTTNDLEGQGNSAPLKKKLLLASKETDTHPSPRSPSPPPAVPRSQTVTTVRRQLLSPVRRSPRSKTTLSGREETRRNLATPPRVQALSISHTTASRSSANSAEKEDVHSVPELLRQVLAKLDHLQSDMTALRNHMTTADVEVEDIESFLPSQRKLDSSEDIKQLEESLDESSRKKMITSLASLQGGNDAGEICRTVMRALMTNNAMSQYSGTGQKGKLPFIGTPLYKIILSAARKASKKTLAFQEIKTEVLDVLRNAPNKPGGTNYIKKRGNKRTRPPLIDEFPEDSS